MTAHARLVRLQRSLAITLAVRSLLIGGTVAVVMVIVAHLLALPSWATALAVLIGAAVAAALLLRLRAVQSLSRVALWVEERTPSLRYSLVTIADGVRTPGLEMQALGVPWWTDAQRALLTSLRLPAIIAAVVVALSLWPPLAQRSGMMDVAARTSGAGSRAMPADVLARVRVAVSPPVYAGRAATTVEDPTSVEALVGSVITVSGNGDARRLTAIAEPAAHGVAQRGERWSVTLAMPARPAIVRLHSAIGRDRLIVLAPIADAAPVVTLLLPAHDTIVRRAIGIIPLHAQLRDDIALRDAWFELVVSSGSGENFTFRSTIVARTMMAGRTETTLDARISLDSLKLRPGDIVQLRVVARDGNNVTGPGIGSSETRALRVARADEYDSASVEALPPPAAEGQILSQRMLIDLTETLVRRQRSLARPMLVSESQRIARDERTLRKRVGDIVFQRMGGEPLTEEGGDIRQRGKLTPEQLLELADSATAGASASVMDVEGDETPILAINKPLLEAFNAMWDAGRSLELGEPAKALPPMRIALAAIERARQAERIYLRGKPNAAIVDVAKARLTGKDKGVASIREARRVVDPVVRRRSATFERAIALIARDPDAAADSLLVMRVEALGDAPAFAAALDDAARALRRRDAANSQLAVTRVRRTLDGPPRQRAGVSAWESAP